MEKNISAAIIGASGYTGQELMRILMVHPKVNLKIVTSRQYEGEYITTVFPNLFALPEKRFEKLDLQKIKNEVQVVFLALPHQKSMEMVPPLIEAGVKVIDLSADFRLNKNTYEKWYVSHTCPEYLKEAVYGLPELFFQKIKEARLIANPGCYPTSVILPLAPLLKEGLIEPEEIIVDSKSGTSGAGRKPSVNTLYCEVNEDFKAYKVGAHRHQPEMEYILNKYADKKAISLLFTPHLLPINRGIFTSIYCKLKKEIEEEELRSLLQKFYKNAPFVKILPEGTVPRISGVRGSNYCHINLFYPKEKKRLILFSAIDNLVKGASGQAVQNMNIMEGFNENLGLTHIPY